MLSRPRSMEWGLCLALRHERQGLIKLLRQLHHHGAILVKPIAQGMQFQHLLELFEHHDRAHVLQSFQQGVTIWCKPSHASQCLEKPSVEREQMTLRSEATLAQKFPVHKEMFSQTTAVATAPPTTVAERHNFSEPIPQFVLIDGLPLLLYFSQQIGTRSIRGFSRRRHD